MRSPSRVVCVRSVLPVVLCCLAFLIGAIPALAVTVDGKPLGWPFGQPTYSVPDSYHSHFALGQELMQSGNLEGAAREFLECIRLFEPYVAARERQGDYKDTLMMEVYFEPLASTCVNLGHSLRAMHRLDTAIQLYTAAADIAPGYVPAHQSLGQALTDKGEALYMQKAAASKAIDPIKPDDSELNLYRSAITHLYVAVQLEPTNADVRVALSRGLRLWGVLDGALIHAQKAVQLDASNAVAHQTLAKAYSAMGQLQEATDEFREATRLAARESDGYQAELQNELGLSLAALGKFDEAVVAARKATTLDPTNAVYQNNLGAGLRGAGKAGQATSYLAAAIALSPDTTEYYTNLAAACRANGDLSGAVTAYRQALRLDPKEAKIHHHLGLALYQRGQLVNAVSNFSAIKDAEIKDDQVEAALASIANHYLANGRLAQVDAMDPRSYDAVPRVALQPNRWPKMKSELTTIAALLDNEPLYGDARLALQALVTHFDALEPAILRPGGKLSELMSVRAGGTRAVMPSEVPEALVRMAAIDSPMAGSIQGLTPQVRRAALGAAQALVQLGDLNEAIAELRWANNLDRRNPYVLVDWGKALLATAKGAEALGKFRQAAAIGPDMAEAHYFGGVALARLGRIPQAVDAWQRAIALGIEDPELCLRLGIVNMQSTELDYAEAMFKQALELDETNAPATYYLGLLQALRLSASPLTTGALANARLNTPIGRRHYNVRGEFIEIKAFQSAMATLMKADQLDPDRKQDYCAVGVELALHDPMLSDIAGVNVIHCPNNRAPFWKTWTCVTNNMAVCAALQGNYDKAERLLHTAVADEPDYALAHWNLGRVLMETKREAQAQQELDLAAKLSRRQNAPYAFALRAVAPAEPVAVKPGLMAAEVAPLARPGTGIAPVPWCPGGLLEAFNIPESNFVSGP